MAFRRLLIVLAVLVLIQVSPAEALTINEIKLNISGSGLVLVSEDLTVFSNETKVGLLLPQFSSLSISSSGVSIPYTSKPAGKGFLVEMNLRGLTSDIELRDVYIQYETQSITSKNGSTWSISFNTEATPRKTIIKMYLPKNSTIISLLPPDVFFSVDRDSLWLYPQEEEFDFNCSYKHAGDLATPAAVDEEGYGSLVLLIPVILLIAIALVVLYYVIKRRSSSRVVGRLELEKDVVAGGEHSLGSPDVRKSDGGIEFEFKTEKTIPKVKSTVLNVLDGDEKNILSLIQEHGSDDITQAFIYKTTRMPKSSLSEIIKRLEKRNVIECRREGRVNWIRLKKWILD